MSESAESSNTPGGGVRRSRRRRDADLAVLGKLAATLSPDDLAATLGPALATLRRASGALEVRLLLNPPPGGAPLLVARAGATRRAGVASTRLPIPGPRRALGQLEADWPDERECSCGRALLERAAGPLATALRAGLAAHRDAADEAVESARGLLGRRRAFLDAVRRASGAVTATLVASVDDEGAEPTVLATGPRPSLCAHALAGGRFRCALLADGQPRALTGPRSAWPEPCRALDPETTSPTCLPLGAGEQLRAAVILDYGVDPPAPLGRDLVPLLTMTRAVEARIVPAKLPPRVLEIRCLGGLELALDGRRLPAELFKRRKALELLQALLLANGRPVGRDDLARLLWPDAGCAAGANRLHGVVHALRSVIEPQRDRRAWVYVRQQDDHYLFDPTSPHWIDVDAFSRHEAAAAGAERAGHVEQAIDHLESALGLYRGDLFEGTSPAAWFELERAEFRRRCLGVISRLAELRVRTGDPDRAVDCLRRGLLIDPLREDLHQALIQTLAETGRREEARAQYRACARALRAELDVEPLPATQRLLRLIGS